MNSFLLTFDEDHTTRLQMQDWLDTRQEILNWVGCLTNLILITSHSNAAQLGQIIRTSLPGLFFVVAEVHRTTTDGWMQELFWTHLLTPTHVPPPK